MITAAVFFSDTTLIGQGVIDNVKKFYNTYKIKKVEAKRKVEEVDRNWMS